MPSFGSSSVVAPLGHAQRKRKAARSFLSFLLNSGFETLVFPILDLFRISCFAFRISALICREIMLGHSTGGS